MVTKARFVSLGGASGFGTSEAVPFPNVICNGQSRVIDVLKYLSTMKFTGKTSSIASVEACWMLRLEYNMDSCAISRRAQCVGAGASAAQRERREFWQSLRPHCSRLIRSVVAAEGVMREGIEKGKVSKVVQQEKTQ